MAHTQVDTAVLRHSAASDQQMPAELLRKSYSPHKWAALSPKELLVTLRVAAEAFFHSLGETTIDSNAASHRLPVFVPTILLK